jgi:uncharacterized protein with NRDE domain
MCLVLLAHDCVPGYRLIVIANRDEYHARSAAPAAFWQDAPGLLAGRDLEGGGTWLGVDRRGRFATVTNVRAERALRRGLRSRGLIVTDFLRGADGGEAFATALAADAAAYDGFNLLAVDGDACWWYSNQRPGPRRLGRGIHTLSNADLDTPWPKTERLRDGFEALVADAPTLPLAALLELLRDTRRAADAELPATGLPRDLERALSSIFITGESYGTRCSTVVTIDTGGQALFHERRYDARGRATGDSHFEFELAAAAT